MSACRSRVTHGYTPSATSTAARCSPTRASTGADPAENILGVDALARSDGPISPRVVFTRPQVAAVGLTLADARSAGHSVTAIDLSTSATAGASFYGRGAAGTGRVVVDTEHHVLLGVTFVGAEVADFLPAATIAVSARVPLGALAHAIAAFPTRSELWLQFLEAYKRTRACPARRPGVAGAVGVRIRQRAAPARTKPAGTREFG